MRTAVANGDSAAKREFDRMYRQGGAFLAATQLTRIPILLTDVTLRGDPIIFANGAFLDFFGYSQEEVVGHQIEEFWDSESCVALKRIRSDVTEQSGKPLDIVLRRKHGEATTMSVVMLPVFDATGAVVHHFVSFLDRSEISASDARIKTLMIENARLVKALAERDLLVVETNHRVKNALMQASMLLMLGGANSPHPDVAEALASARMRLQAMAGIYDLLSTRPTQAIDLAALLRSLAPQLVPPVLPVEIETHLADRVMLSPDVAQPMALIAVELVTNAVKHAFPQRREGRVRIELLPTSAKGIELTIADNGTGMAEGAAESLGYRLVRALAKQVSGVLNVRSTGGGTTVTVTLSADRPAQGT